MTLFERSTNRLHRVDIPTVARNVYDVTGAGDTAIAAFAAAVAAGAELQFASHIANVAAGIVVGKRGTATVTIEEIGEYFASGTKFEHVLFYRLSKAPTQRDPSLGPQRNARDLSPARR